MFKRVLIAIYKIVPSGIKSLLGQSLFLKPLRDKVLRGRASYLEASAKIETQYGNYPINFWFFSTVKEVAKAQKKGIERSLLLNSMTLMQTKKTHNNDCVVLDIGANFGYLSLVWSNSLSKHNGQVFAFEPNPDVYKTFVKSVNKNNLSAIITPEHCALGAEEKQISLYLSETTSNTIQMATSKRKVAIDMITIDGYYKRNNISRCDLIKIDVDGIELDILQGGEYVMETFKPIYIVETNDDMRIVDFFIDRHYSVLDMQLNEYEIGTDLPLNIFCVPKQ